MRHGIYLLARDDMRPGDLIAFGGTGAVSSTIKRFTGAPVSHVGAVLRTMDQPGSRVDVIESTSLGDFCGVRSNRLSERLEHYADGQVWWCPLDSHARARLNVQRFKAWLLKQSEKPYDAPGAILSGLDRLDGMGATLAREELERLFCSEAIAAAFREGGILPARLNPSEITPIDLVRFDLFAEAVQLVGVPTAIRGYSTVLPETWAA